MCMDTIQKKKVLLFSKERFKERIRLVCRDTKEFKSWAFSNLFLNAQKKDTWWIDAENCNTCTEWHQSMPCLILLAKAILSRFLMVIYKFFLWMTLFKPCFHLTAIKKVSSYSVWWKPPLFSLIHSLGSDRYW